MHEKNFEGCGGFKLTESEQVIISAYAGLLIIGEPSGILSVTENHPRLSGKLYGSGS
jgi:Mlc titration factor MtfA (ptsG expression regulator)